MWSLVMAEIDKLRHSLESRDEEAVAKMIQDGLDVNTEVDDDTLLVWAVKQNMKVLVNTLLGHSTLDLNAMDAKHHTALYHALKKKKFGMVKAMLDRTDLDVLPKSKRSTSMLELAIDAKAPDDIVKPIFERTVGHPDFTIDLIKHLVQEGMVDEMWKYAIMINHESIIAMLAEDLEAVIEMNARAFAKNRMYTNKPTAIHEMQETVFPDHVKYVESLTPRQKAIIRLYTGLAFVPMNTAFRHGHLSHLHNEITDIFVNAPPTTESATVFRGTFFDIEGSHLEKGILSTSLDLNVGVRFISDDGCCLYMITVPVGTKLLPIEALSAIGNENEVLLEPNGILVITGETTNEMLTKRGDQVLVTVKHVTYLPQGSVAV